MKCPRCQQESPADADFCPECGTKLAVVCVACGIVNAPTHKFCKKCGQALGTGADRSQTNAPFKSPSSYTPKHLAEKILTSKTEFGGERKQVTVLFADLKGSTELIADRDPEEARKLLDVVLEQMMDAVHRYEGLVNNVMGDGIMAIFGAPIAHEDHAVRACYAALHMQASVKRYAEEVRRTQGVVIRIRVGLNSGEVVIRLIANDLHIDYSAVGPTTHLAARMEQLADPGSILLAPKTFALAEGYVEVKSLGLVPVKGLSDPVEVYEMRGASAARSRLQAAAARGFTRFVGRGTEIEQLRSALALAQDRHGQLIAAVGEPGVGKSRLLYEFTHSHRTQDWLILEAMCSPYGKATSYLPVIYLLKAYFKVHDRETHREIGEKVTGKLLAMDRALEPILPALLALLDVPVDRAQWQALDPQQRRQRTLEGLRRLLLRESQVQPLLLVFEDLQWVDTETQAFLDSLVETLPRARLLLLVTYRPEYQQGWSNKTYYRHIRIDPLPNDSADDLLAHLLGRDSNLELLKRSLIERTDGNPLFLEESVRTLIETKVLSGERGAYRLAQAGPTIQMPPTIQAILASRIDRLPPQEKELLQSAAVIGKDVPFVLLQNLTNQNEDALRRELAHLQSAEFLYESSLFPDLEYTFKHTLTHEVAYSSLIQNRRRSLHARIVQTTEALYPDRLGEHLERLAQHAFRGEVWDKAVAYLWQSATKKAARSAYRDAVQCLEQALEALAHVPESHETITHAIDLRLALHGALSPLSQAEKMVGHLREAEALATTSADHTRLGQVFARECLVLRQLGDLDSAIAVGERALAIATDLNDTGLEVTATHRLGQAYFSNGDLLRARKLLRRTVEIAGEGRLHDDFRSYLRARAWLGLALANVGEFTEAITLGAEAVRIVESSDQPAHIVVMVYTIVGYFYEGQGQFQRAITLFERALEAAQGSEIIDWAPEAGVGLGRCYAFAGRVADGLQLIEQAVGVERALMVRNGLSLSVGVLGRVYLLTGRVDEARECAREARELAQKHKERGNEAHAVLLLGDLASDHALVNEPTAEEHYLHAMALARELEMRPLIAHCHLSLGKLCHRTDKREEAQEHLATATTMYREMGMTYWLEKAEAEMTN